MKSVEWLKNSFNDFNLSVCKCMTSGIPKGYRHFCTDSKCKPSSGGQQWWEYRCCAVTMEILGIQVTTDGLVAQQSLLPANAMLLRGAPWKQCTFRGAVWGLALPLPSLCTGPLLQGYFGQRKAVFYAVFFTFLLPRLAGLFFPNNE